MKTAPKTAGEWFATPLGEYLLVRELAYFDRAVSDIFGYNAFQLGMIEHDLLRASRIPMRCHIDINGAAQLRADFHDLPIASNSTDLVVLPHVLEFSEHPHQILREVARVLLPEAHVVISGFNPRSLWGLKRMFHSREQYPWGGRFINLPRLKDWLALLGFEITAGQMSCYAPPCTQQKWLTRFDCMESAGDRWWPMAGGVYYLQAVKRVRGVRLIMPKWSDSLASKKNLAAVSQKLGNTDDTLAARTKCRDS